MSGRAPRQKGDRAERELVKRLVAAGVEAKRVPLSGSARGYPGDVVVKLGDRELTVEVKARADFKTLHTWLQDRDALILKADRKAPLVVLKLQALLDFLEANHDRVHS